MREGLILKARWALRRKGKIFRSGHNLVTNAGYTLLLNRLAGISETELTHVAYGDDGTAPALGQTALIGTEIDRVALTPAVSANQLTMTATLSGPTPDETVQEFGIFNDATAGDMFSRFVTSAFVFGDGDDIDFEWILTVQ